jgi:class 3 adenylate cyclase
MFCDLVGSTALSAQLDPEELQELVHAYQECCAAVIGRYEGHVAQYLRDGLLVYFGYPTAHEDDARRALYTALEILAELRRLNTPLPRPHTGDRLQAGDLRGEGLLLLARERNVERSDLLPGTTPQRTVLLP